MKTKPGNYPLVTMGEEHKTAENYQLDTEAVCIPMISSYGHGKAGLKRVHYINGKFALSNILSALIIKEPSMISTKYLALYLQTFKDQLIVPLQTGAANMSLRPEKLASVPIRYPNMQTQKKIVDLIEKADKLKLRRNEAINVTYSLIPTIFRAYIGDPITNPLKWTTYKLSNISEVIRGITFKPSDKLEINDIDSIVCLRTKNIQENLELNDVIYIPRSFVHSKKQLIQAGDILISNANSKELVGKCCLVNELNVEATLGGFITALRVTNSDILSHTYLYWWINSPEIQSKLRNFSRQTTNIANLPMTSLLALKVPVPPITVQLEFSKQAQVVQHIRNSQQESSVKIESLYKSLLSQAFAGVL